MSERAETKTACKRGTRARQRDGYFGVEASESSLNPLGLEGGWKVAPSTEGAGKSKMLFEPPESVWFPSFEALYVPSHGNSILPTLENC
jgi:hypothetical protein